MIVISSVCDNLNTFLQNNKEDFSYVHMDLYAPDIEKFLEDRRYKKVNINGGLGGIDFEKEYINFIGSLNRDYNSLVWFATTVSYKGSFPLNLYTYLFNYYCVTALIMKQKDANYIVVSDDSSLNNSIRRYCEENNIVCKFLDEEKRKTRFIHYKRLFLNRIYFLCEGWSRKMRASIYLSGNIKKSLKKNASYYVVRSWINDKAFIGDKGYKDLYFGSLIEYLKKKRIEFIILSGILTDYKDMIRKIKNINQILVIPQEYFIGYLDYIKAIIVALAKRPKIARPIIFCGLDVTDLLKECLDKDYECNEINKNLLYGYYAKGLLRKVRVNTFLFSFENQSWERMTVFALRKYSPSTKIIGYAHSPLSPFLVNYACSREEENIIPLPDKIVTIGKEVKEFLQEYGNYKSSVKLSEGCALRYEHIFKKERIGWNQNGKILAALSMEFNLTLRMLRFLYDALAGKDGYKVVLRAHPFMPIEAILIEHDLILSDNFRISKNLRFEEDLKDSSLLIYTDTTCSMEALMGGMPLIHLDLKESICRDPLFKLNSLKWIVSTKSEIYKAIEYIYKMDKKEYLEEYSKALFYLKNCFYPIEERYLEEFIA